ncbi:hypothetical protein [Flavobacterium aestivum]|uniref:hypothetical protein n=1 Tax=Flavobacterium aestivum TaxID=3003257 RepID=UPI002286C057|nr:hypothetical protein [Flavobacterium aestivum]
MLKNILNLKGAQKLTASEQKSIKAGDTGISCGPQGPSCGPGQTNRCINGRWVCTPSCPTFPYC